MSRLCQSSGFTPRVVLATGHMLTRFGLIASGCGCTCCIALGS